MVIRLLAQTKRGNQFEDFKMLLLSLQCLLLLLPLVFGGTQCPPREGIRPCICLNRSLGKKKLETTLICHNLADDASVHAMNIALSDMEIDKFLLYDSFWKMAPKSVPATLLTNYRIHELEIVDTIMKNFGCATTANCATIYLKRLSSVNSTLSEKPECNQALTIHSWISCPEPLEYLKISQGMPSDFSLKIDFFPQFMPKLKELHLPHNKITRVERRTFTSTRFPALLTLDLSNNLIRDVRQIFSTPMKIKYLDLSFNEIRNTLDFTNLPQLETLKLVSTQITTLVEPEWRRVTTQLRHLDLSGNSLKCDCTSFQWVNSTFHINTNLVGSCDSPSQIKGMKLRKASRTLIERCDDNNNIGSRKKLIKT